MILLGAGLGIILGVTFTVCAFALIAVAEDEEWR